MKGQIKWIVGGGLIMVLAAGAAFWWTQRATAAMVIERAQGAWEELRSYQGTVAMKMDLGPMKMTFQCQQWYAAPDRFRMEMDLGMPGITSQTYVLDGDTMLMEMPMVDKVIRVTGVQSWNLAQVSSEMTPGSSDPRQNGSLEWILRQLDAQKARLGPKVEVAGQPCFVLIQPCREVVPEQPAVDKVPGMEEMLQNHPFFKALREGEIHIAISRDFYWPLQWTLRDPEGNEVLSYTFEEFEPNVDLPEDLFTLDTEEKEVVDIEAGSPEKLAPALLEAMGAGLPTGEEARDMSELMAGTPVTLEEAQEKVDFPLFAPAELEAPTKVEYVDRFGTTMITLHFVQKDRTLQLQEIPIDQAMPLETAKSLPGVQVVPLEGGGEGIQGDMPLVGGNCFTWQDAENGVDFTLIGEEWTTEELVALAESMEKL